MSETKRGIFEDDEGNCCVICPSPNALKNGAVLSEIFAKAAGGKSVDVIEGSELPNDRYFRNAWKKGTNIVSVDMPKARDIQMGIIREKRNEKLQEADIEWQREVESELLGNDVTVKKTSIANKKQTLRDLPATFDLTTATTPEELKLMIPTELTE